MTNQLEAATASADPATAPQATNAVSTLKLAPLRLYVIFLLLLVSALAWRKGVYYSGGADLVVVAKGGLTLLAFALAVTAPRPALRWSHLRAAPVLWLGAYLAVATIGGLLQDQEPLPSMILVARLALLAVVLVLTVRAYSWSAVISALAGSMLLVGIFAAATGIGTLAEGRLAGGIPPISPNEICLLISVPLITIMWRCLNHGGRWLDVCLIPVLMAMVWATGSRTGLAALMVAALLLLMSSRRLSVPIFTALMAAVPACMYVVGWTPLVSGFVDRGDAASLFTLNSRTVAWSSAVEYADTLAERLFGAGLAVKRIPVSAMYRDEQIFDSSWVSAIVQVGVLGILALVLLVWVAVRAAGTSPRPERSLYLAILLFLLIVSLLESGLFDTTVSFIVFFSLTLCASVVRPPERKP